jgi:ABC-type nitrate/sulfonate/bicarbonate transport system substrate-binding protein
VVIHYRALMSSGRAFHGRGRHLFGCRFRRHFQRHFNAVARALRALQALALVGLAWAAGSSDAAAADPLRTPLRVAVSSTPHASLLHLAAAIGSFAEQGIAVELVPVSHGKAALDKLAAGEVELAAAAEVPFVVGVLQGQPWSVLASVASTNSEMALVARRDRGITGPADLAGKRVGVTLGTSGEYFLWAWMIRQRLPADALMQVDLAPNRLAQALAEGSVDAVATWQPVRQQAERALGANGLTFTAPLSYTTTHVVVGRQSTLAADPPAMGRFVRALLKAEAFARRQQQQALDLVAQRLKLPAAELQPLWTGLSLRVDQRQSQLITWEDEARWALARGYVPAQPVPNLLPHLDLAPLAAEAPGRVTVVH